MEDWVACKGEEVYHKNDNYQKDHQLLQEGCQDSEIRTDIWIGSEDHHEFDTK
jgi:hypothetical protein